jgi:hypothetical protein
MATTTVSSIFGTPRTRIAQNLSAVSLTLTDSDSGIEQNMATDAKVYTLPLITSSTLGLTLIFRNTGADGNNLITISPNALDGINGTIANAAADSVAGGVVNKNLVNTKATSNKGDFVVLTAVSLTEWYISGGVGIWASEA